MKKMMFALVAATVVAAPVVTRAQADSRPTVAVLPFNNGVIGRTGMDYSNIGKGVEDFMITELSRNTALRVVERANIQKILDEQNLGSSGRVDDATAARLGKIFGAKHMVTGGVVSQPDGTMRLEMRVIEVETTRIEWTGSQPGKLDNLLDVIQQGVDKMSAAVKLPPIPASAKGTADAGAAKDKKMPLATAMLYARALEARDSGKTEQAITLYKQVAKDFPGYAPAEKALKELDKSSK